MATFLFATYPLLGHVNPALPIARTLTGRGHTVWWYTGQRFRSAIAATGARFVPMHAAPDPHEGEVFTRLPALRGLAAANWGIKRAFLDPIPGQVADLRAFLAETAVDVVLADQVFGGAEVLHALGGPPWATLGISALTLSSRDTAPATLALPPAASPVGRLRNHLLNWLFKRVVLRDAHQHLNCLRWTFGLPPVQRDLFDMASPYLYLHSSTEAFEYPRSDLAPQVHFIGPLLPEATHAVSLPDWWGDMQGGRPVVLVNQGTIATNSADLIVPTLQALADEDVLVVATTGGVPAETIQRAWVRAQQAAQATNETELWVNTALLSGSVPFHIVPAWRPALAARSLSHELPANARVAPFIPFAALLPHVSLMITNGGYGGVQFALAHGVPLVVAGGSEEKPTIAARVAWSGAGIDLKTGQPTPAQIRAAVHNLLHTPGYRQHARRLQADYARHNAPATAADLLEHLAYTRQPVLRAWPTPPTPRPQGLWAA